MAVYRSIIGIVVQHGLTALQCTIGVRAIASDMDEMNRLLSNAECTDKKNESIVAAFVRCANVNKSRHARDSNRYNMDDVVIVPDSDPLAASPTDIDQSDELMRSDSGTDADAADGGSIRQRNSASSSTNQKPKKKRKKSGANDEDEEIEEDTDRDEPRSVIEAKYLKLKLKYEKTKLARHHYKKEYLLLIVANRRLAPSADVSVNHRIMAWIHSAVRLDYEEQGLLAQVGVGVFVKGAHPSFLNDMSPADVKALPAADRPSLCFYKRSFVSNSCLDRFTSESEVMSAIRKLPSVYLPTVYGAAGMLEAITRLVYEAGDGDQADEDKRKKDVQMLNATYREKRQVVMCGATEYLRGMPLDLWLTNKKERRRLASMSDEDRRTDCLKISAQISRGLIHLHKAGAVHRDIKSNNVMIMSPNIYNIVASRDGFRLHSDAPYPEDAALASIDNAESQSDDRSEVAAHVVLPTSNEARRSLHADGYASTFAFDKVHFHPTVPDDVSGYRVVIIDFNTSILLNAAASVMTLDMCHKYCMGVQEYMKQPTRYSVDEKEILGPWMHSADPNLTTTLFWEHYDQFGLAMVILDVFRGVSFDLLPNPEREEMLAKYRLTYLEYCRARLDVDMLPSMYGFMCTGLRDAHQGMFVADDFIIRSRAAQQVLSKMDRLNRVLHHATATSWKNDRTQKVIAAVTPSLAEIEIVLMESLAHKSVKEKMTIYKLDIVMMPTDGDCIFHSFKQQADLLRGVGDERIDFFPPQLTRMLDGASSPPSSPRSPASSPSGCSSSSSSSPSPSRGSDAASPDHRYVKRMRDGLVHWLTLRLGTGESEIDCRGGFFILNAKEPAKAKANREEDAPILPPPVVDAAASSDVEIVAPSVSDQYAINKRRVEAATKIHMLGLWNTLNGDRVVEMLAQMFDVSILIIYAKSGDRKYDTLINEIEAIKGRPRMKFYRTVGHYEGTKPR